MLIQPFVPFVVGVVCPRDVILPVSGDPPAGILQRGIAFFRAESKFGGLFTQTLPH